MGIQQVFDDMKFFGAFHVCEQIHTVIAGFFYLGKHGIPLRCVGATVDDGAKIGGIYSHG